MEIAFLVLALIGTATVIVQTVKIIRFAVRRLRKRSRRKIGRHSLTNMRPVTICDARHID